ncbi:MAG: hypothetical protein ACRD4Y_11465, partial [Candidatus Acidiferrales bacterium]
RQLLEADLATASVRWNQKMEASIEDAARQVASRLAMKNEASAKEADQLLQERITAIRHELAQATDEAETMIGGLRKSISSEAARGESTITQMREAVAQLDTKRADLDTLLQTSLDEWAQRSQAAVETHSEELNRRAESAVAGMAERLQPVLESSGNETIGRLAQELNQRLSPEIARASEMVDKLAQVRELSEKAYAEHQHRLWQASEHSVQDAVARSKELLAQVEKEFADSARAMSSKWFSELESKATETTHTTFEALFKSAEWYEKKVQNQMQATLERGLDQAASSLREKAAELSGLYASELDHYSRGYTEHARNQIQEDAREAAEHANVMMAEAGDKAAAEFTERAGQLGGAQLDAFASRAETAFEQAAAGMEAHTAQVRSKMEKTTNALAAEYQQNLAQHTEQALAKTKDDLAMHVEQAKDALRAETRSIDQEFRSAVQSISASAMDEHKQRLENASNSWLLTTVTKLNQQSESLIDQLAASTEKRLKTVCGNVFAEMGETLRQRLAGFSDPFTSSTSRTGQFSSSTSNPFDKKSEDKK